MKKLFSSFLLVGACIALLFTSCNHDPNIEIPLTQPPFNIEVSNVATTTATVAVTPLDKEVLYYFDVFDASVWESDATDAQIAEEILQLLLDDYEESKDFISEYYGIDNFADAYLSKGDDTYDFTGLKGATSYYVVAFAIDTVTNTVNSELTKELFITADILPSENVISFEQDAEDKSLIYINTTNDDSYIWTYLSAAEMLEYNGDAQAAWTDMVEIFNEYGLLDWVIVNGSDYFSTKDYLTDPSEVGTYTLIAAGYDGGQTTELFTYEFEVTEDMLGTEEEGGDDDDLFAAPRKLSGKVKANAPQFKLKKRK